MKKLLILLLLCSCAAQPRLHNTGSYTIKTKVGDAVTLVEVSGTYQIPFDTLKAGDKIIINVVKLKRH